ncbi:hypothetical protein [Porphyromonas sp.]
MTQSNIIDLLIIACNFLLVWSIAATLTLWNERKELKKLHKSKEELRDSMASYNYYLYEQLRRTKRENEDLRTYIYHQQKQDNG